MNRLGHTVSRGEDLCHDFGGESSVHLEDSLRLVFTRVDLQELLGFTFIGFLFVSSICFAWLRFQVDIFFK